MKLNKLLVLLATSGLVFGCEQEIPELTPPAEISGEPGSADFTKFVSIGNSLTAGFQSGALFTEGQNNSYPAIMAEHFAYVSTNDPFDQPTINSVNGFNSTFSNIAAAPPVIRGRLVLFDPDGTGPRTPAPAPAGTPGVPAPYNTADPLSAFTGDKTALNNFGVPGILLGQALTPLTGGPSTGNPAFNPYYQRFASNPGTSTIIGDALAANPTFFSFWLGNNDVLGYATTGASGAIPLTSVANFQGQYTTAINTILASNANLKGIVATIPDVTSIPFFRTVRFNAIPMDAPTAAAVNAGFAGFNAILTAIQGNASLMTNFGLNAADLEARKVSFAAATNNRILIADESLTDLGPVFDYLRSIGQIPSDAARAALVPYQRSRQATATDYITLSAGSVIGTTVGGNPQAVNGVSVPLADQFVLIPTEVTEIRDRTTAFNDHIKAVVNTNSTRLALADMNLEFNNVVNGVVTSVDGLPVNATFTPPFGLFSEDGVHPNNKGSAYIAKIFINAINQKFGSTIPSVNITKYKSVPVPVSPVVN